MLGTAAVGLIQQCGPLTPSQGHVSLCCPRRHCAAAMLLSHVPWEPTGPEGQTCQGGAPETSSRDCPAGPGPQVWLEAESSKPSSVWTYQYQAMGKVMGTVLTRKPETPDSTAFPRRPSVAGREDGRPQARLHSQVCVYTQPHTRLCSAAQGLDL